MSEKIEIKGVYEPRFEPVAKLLRKQIKHYGGGAAAAVFLGRQTGRRHLGRPGSQGRHALAAGHHVDLLLGNERNPVDRDPHARDGWPDRLRGAGGHVLARIRV